MSIYVDHAATTPLDRRVLAAMAPFLGERFGNPSSLYQVAREARRAVDQARDDVAVALGCRSSEIVFTASGSESDNMALKGVAFAHLSRPGQIISSPIEHHAVLQSLEFLEKLGFSITFVPVDRLGRVDPDDIGRAISPQTVLISIMAANNEVGTLQPIADIARIARQRKIPFHTDAVQAAGALDLDVERLGVDLLSLSGHKFYGPKGVGALYIRRGTTCWPLIHGGGQERGRRAGTENVGGIVGLAAALRLAGEDRAAHNRQVSAFRDRAISQILARVAGAQLTGHPTDRLPNNASFCFDQVEGESLLLALDQREIMASSGSACTSGSLEPSHVLLAMGLTPDQSRGSLRLTFGRDNTLDDVDDAVAAIEDIVGRLRGLQQISVASSRL